MIVSVRLTESHLQFLGHVGEEFLKVVKIQSGTGELRLDEIPDPLEESGEGDVGAIRSVARPASEQRNKLASGGDDERSRITSFGEGAGGALVWKDGHLERFHIAAIGVLADERHKPGERANGGVGSEAALENATNAIAFEVQCVGTVDLIGGEHSSESKETVVGVLELGWDVVILVHQAFELRTGRIRTKAQNVADHVLKLPFVQFNDA